MRIAKHAGGRHTVLGMVRYDSQWRQPIIFDEPQQQEGTGVRFERMKTG